MILKVSPCHYKFRVSNMWTTSTYFSHGLQHASTRSSDAEIQMTLSELCSASADTLHMETVLQTIPKISHPKGSTVRSHLVAVTIENITPVTVAQTRADHWILVFCVQVTILTDRSTQFQSILFNGITERLCTWWFYTAVNHIQANGVIQRLLRTLKTSSKEQSVPQN